MKYFLYLTILILSLSACSIQEEIHFNKDYSGKLTYSIDLSNMKTMMSSMGNALGDSTSSENESSMDLNQLSPEMMKGAMGSLKDIEGISNFNSEAGEEGKVMISFDFADINALNKAYNQLNKHQQGGNFLEGLDQAGGFNPGLPPVEKNAEENEATKMTEESEVQDYAYFVKKGKYLIYRRPKMDMDSKEMQEASASMEMLKGMGDMFKVKLKMTFDKKVSKVSSQNIEAFSDDNSVVTELKFDNMATEKEDPQIKIKLK